MNRNTRRLRAIAHNVIDRLTSKDQLANLDVIASQSRAPQDIVGDRMEWKSGNLLPSDGTLKKEDSSYVKGCIIGDGMDVEIGEGAIVIGCTFTRLFRLDIYNKECKELETRHKIKIGPMSIVIGCAFRDSCSVGTHTRAVQTCFTQANIGDELIAIRSAVLLRYGSIGDNAILFHAIVGLDPGTIGNNALFMDGILAVLNPDAVCTTYVDRVGRDVCGWMIRMFNTELIKTSLIHKTEAQLKRENAEQKEWSWGRVSYAEKCFLAGDKLPEVLHVQNLVDYATTNGSWEGTLAPVYFQVHDDIRDPNAKEESYYDVLKSSSQDFYRGQQKRIKIGDNLRVLCNALLRLGAISGNRNYHSGSPSSPNGYSLVGWNKCVRHDYDFLVGNDVTFMCHNTYLSTGYPGNSDCVGRLVLGDGAVLYYDRHEVARSTSTGADLNKTKMMTGYCQSSLPVACSLTVEKNAKLFLYAELKILRDAATSVINTLTVKQGQIAIL